MVMTMTDNERELKWYLTWKLLEKVQELIMLWFVVLHEETWFFSQNKAKTPDVETNGHMAIGISKIGEFKGKP